MTTCEMAETLRKKIVVSTAAQRSLITLADRVIAATLNRHYLVDRGMPPREKIDLSEGRNRIKKARRILLDDEFVRAATVLSLKPASVLLEKFPMIQALGENVWIEWNERTWAETVEATPGGFRVEDTTGYMGMLIDRLESNNGSCLRINVVRFIKNYVVFHECGFWLSLGPEEGLVLPKGIPSNDLTVSHAITCAEGETCYALGEWDERTHRDPIERDAYASLKSRVGYFDTGVTWINVNVIPHYSEVTESAQPEIYIEGAQSVTGNLRFLIAALILTTAEEVISDEPWISTGARAPTRSTRLRLPGNVFRTLRLSAPKERVLDKILNYVPPATPTGIRKRRHHVRPHVARSRKKGSPICPHEFDQVPLPHFCVMCGYREWPRKEHYRGDEKLGTVYGPTRIEGRREGSNR